jgi:DNA-binding NarL/FixJ family response regulator
MIKAVIVEAISDQLEKFVKYDPMFNLIAKYSGAKSALANIPHDKPNIVILDIGLPGPKNGLDVLAILRRKHLEMKFLIYTVFDSEEKLLKAFALGAYGYILKSEPITTIPNYCTRIMEGELVVTELLLKR